MKRIQLLILPLTLALGLSACRSELEDFNRNPNEATEAQPDYILTNAQKASADLVMGSDASMETTALFIQYWAKIQYTDVDKYTTSPTNVQNIWTNSYTQSLNDYAELIRLGEKTQNPNYQAIGIIMKSWAFQVLTDLYGDIPYSQALKINEFLTPKYDAQKDVYTGLLADLQRAVSLINDSGSSPVAGDIIYKGDMKRWRKFAQSLRLRIALRIADKDAAAARTVISGLSKTDLISSNDETAQFVYLTSPNQNPVSRDRETRDDYRVSKTIVDKLLQLNDPRLGVYVNKTADYTPQGYIGVTNGLPADSAARLGFTKTSKLGDYFTAASAPAVFINYAEVLFNLAEAAQRGFISDDAATLYKQAVTASLQQYRATADDITKYLAQPAVAYDAAAYKKSIGEQKWLALFGESQEAFAEWRRLDYPQLKPAYAGVLNGRMPLRLPYPTGEQALNNANYKAAVASQGADLLTTKLWFDAN